MIPLTALRYIGAPLALVALIAWLWIGWTNADNRADDLSKQVRVQTARADAAEKREMVMRQAEAERMMDESHLDQVKDDLTHAIDNAPKGTSPGPATVAVNCARYSLQYSKEILAKNTTYNRICNHGK